MLGQVPCLAATATADHQLLKKTGAILGVPDFNIVCIFESPTCVAFALTKIPKPAILSEEA